LNVYQRQETGDTMTLANKRAALIGGIAVLIGAAACSNKSQPTDNGLKADLDAAVGSGLQLAPKGNPSQVVVSALEGGPQSAPTHAAPKRIPKPSPKPNIRVAAKQAPAPAPAPAPVQRTIETAPAAEPVPAPQPQQSPAAARPQQQPQRQQPGVYKTEGEIFKQMPWIRP
jgi:outer membrane biosynthesis protein TonB